MSDRDAEAMDVLLGCPERAEREDSERGLRMVSGEHALGVDEALMLSEAEIAGLDGKLSDLRDWADSLPSVLSGSGSGLTRLGNYQSSATG